MNPTHQQQRKMRRIIVYASASILFSATFIFLIWSLRPMLLPFILGVFFAYLFKPVINFSGSNLSKYLKASFLVFFVVSLFYGGVRLVEDSLPTEKEKLELLVRLQYHMNERYIDIMKIDEKTGKGNFIYEALKNQLNPMVKKINEFVTLTPDQQKLFLLYKKGYKGELPVSDKYYDYFLVNLKAEHAENFLTDTTVTNEKPITPAQETESIFSFMHIISIWLIFPLTFIFILFDKGNILKYFVKLIPNRYFELSLTVFNEVDLALGKYIRGTVIECTLVGLTLALGLFFCGMQLKIAFLIGAIGGLTNAIPFFGTIIALVVGSTYALIAEDITPLIPFMNTSNLMLGVFICVLVAHFLDNAIYQPLVVGGAVNLHPLLVILSVFAGSMLFGFAGLLLAIPTIVILKVVTETLFQGLKAYRII